MVTSWDQLGNVAFLSKGTILLCICIVFPPSMTDQVLRNRGIYFIIKIEKINNEIQ